MNGLSSSSVVATVAVTCYCFLVREVVRKIILFQRKIRQQIQDRIALRESDIKDGWTHAQGIRNYLLGFIYMIMAVYIGFCGFVVLTYGVSQLEMFILFR